VNSEQSRPRASGDSLGRAARPVGLNRAVVDVFADLLGNRLGDYRRRSVVEVHASSRAVALEAVEDMDVLLEVVLEREVDERLPVGGGLRRRR